MACFAAANTCGRWCDCVLYGGPIFSATVMTVHSTSIRRSAEATTVAAGSGGVRSGFYRNFVKRPIDVLAVVFALPIVLPFMAILAIFISIDGYSPFFRQERVGLGSVLQKEAPDGDPVDGPRV